MAHHVLLKGELIFGNDQLPLGTKGEKEGGERFGPKLDLVPSSQGSLVVWLPD